jgi:two-component system heavy metal sensor histidine kinase CusS
VLLLATLAVFALDHELDSRARKDLARKMLQVEHNLRVDLRSDDLGTRAHPLLDLVMGHDNLSLSVMATSGRHPALLSLGPALQSRHLLEMAASPAGVPRMARQQRQRCSPPAG